VLGSWFPVIHDQLLYLVDVEGEVVILTPHCQVCDPLPIGCLIRPTTVESSVNLMMVLESCNSGEQGVQESPLRGPLVESQRGGCVVTYPYHLEAARQEVQDPLAEGGVQSQGPELSDEFEGHNGVEC
jgi:hypothetical protein